MQGDSVGAQPPNMYTSDRITTAHAQHLSVGTTCLCGIVCFLHYSVYRLYIQITFSGICS